MRRVVVFGLSLILFVGAVLSGALAAGSNPTTKLVSRQSKTAGDAGADAGANNPSISASGRYVAFETSANNLGGPLDDTVTNIYVYDRKRQKAELISRRSNKGPGANDSSFIPSISASGRYVAFQSTADNLGGPLDGDNNVYVYDRELKKTRLVSRRSGNNGAGGDGDSFTPSISANGRFVAFTSEADNLGGPRDIDFTNIYRYDLRRKQVQLVSRRSGSSGSGANGNSESSSLSADGKLVAFRTDATNLGGPTLTSPGEANVYVRDIATRKVRLVSRRSGGGPGGNGGSFDPFISANGRYVAFESDANNLGGPLMVGDPQDTSIYVHDLAKRKVRLVSRRSKSAGGEGADSDSDDPVLTGDGRYVVFETNARNLGGPLNNDPVLDNLYIYDRKRSKVTLVSRRSGRNGIGGDDDDEDPFIAQDGRFIAFESESDNLGGPDLISGENKIYVRDLGR